MAAIAEFYNVTIDYLIAPADDTDRAQKAVRQQKKQRSGLKGDKLIITLLAVSVVWILVTVLYANLYLAAGINYWLAFVWSVPASAIILIVFNGIWGRRAFSTVFTSALVWTSLVGLYLQLLEYNMWQLFFVGIPLQIAIVLWSRLGKNQKSNS